MSQKCHMLMGPIHNSYWVGNSCIVADVHGCGRTHVIVTMLLVNQIAKRPVILCCEKCAVASKCKHAVFLQKLHRFAFCNATFAVEEFWEQCPRPQIPNGCVFTCVHQCLWEKGSFPSVSCHAEHQVQQNVEKNENVIDITQQNPRIITWKIFALLSIPCMRFWWMLHTVGLYPYHIQCIQHLQPASTG